MSLHDSPHRSAGGSVLLGHCAKHKENNIYMPQTSKKQLQKRCLSGARTDHTNCIGGHASHGINLQKSSNHIVLQYGWRPSLLGARTLLGAPGIATNGAKTLLGAKGIALIVRCTPIEHHGRGHTSKRRADPRAKRWCDGVTSHYSSTGRRNGKPRHPRKLRARGKNAARAPRKTSWCTRPTKILPFENGA